MNDYKVKMSALPDEQIKLEFLDGYTVVVTEMTVSEEDEKGDAFLVIDYDVTEGTPPEDIGDTIGEIIMLVIEEAAKEAEKDAKAAAV